MDSALVVREYTSHLTEADVKVLTAAAERPPDPGGAADRARPAPASMSPAEAAAWLRRNPAALESLLADPDVFRTVAGEGGAVPLSQNAPVSAFLVFAVVVHRSAAELASTSHVQERAGPRQRVPLFDVPGLRDFLGSPARRFFLAELLASFTRVSSGHYRVHRGGQYRTRRYSELDPVRLAGLADAVPEPERTGVYRRLGDVALFLAGVFPDYATIHALSPVNVARLLRFARVGGDQRDHLATAPVIELLEYLGARWYRSAWELAPVRTARLAVVPEVADRFRQARRVLNHITDRYLTGQGGAWFMSPAG